jgi:hypothetical protein
MAEARFPLFAIFAVSLLGSTSCVLRSYGGTESSSQVKRNEGEISNDEYAVLGAMLRLKQKYHPLAPIRWQKKTMDIMHITKECADRLGRDPMFSALSNTPPAEIVQSIPPFVVQLVSIPGTSTDPVESFLRVGFDAGQDPTPDFDPFKVKVSARET